MLRVLDSPRTLAAVLVAFVAVATCAHGAPKTSKSFPEFVGRKPSLPPVTLLCGSYLWLTTKGDIERAKLDETMPVGPEVVSRMKEMLEGKGYRLRNSVFVSSGQTPNPDGDTTGVFLPPFYRDTTVFRHPAITGAWESLLSRLAFYNRGPGESPAYFTEPILLCDSLGGGVMAIVMVKYYRPTSRETREARRRWNPWWGLVPNLPGPQTSVQLTLADGKSGEVLWNDLQLKAGPYKRKTLDELMARILENLP